MRGHVPGRQVGDDPVGDDAREALQRRVFAGELGQLVEHAIAIALDDAVEARLDLGDVQQVAVPVEAIALEDRLESIVVRVGLILAPPVAADQEVLRDEVTQDARR